MPHVWCGLAGRVRGCYGLGCQHSRAWRDGQMFLGMLTFATGQQLTWPPRNIMSSCVMILPVVCCCHADTRLTLL